MIKETNEENVPVIENETYSKQKRGRKPKGGKIKTREPEKPRESKLVTNIILHLKCSNNDLYNYNQKMSQMVIDPLEYKPDIPPDIMTYNNHSGSLNPFQPECYSYKTIDDENPEKGKDSAYNSIQLYNNCFPNENSNPSVPTAHNVPFEYKETDPLAFKENAVSVDSTQNTTITSIKSIHSRSGSITEEEKQKEEHRDHTREHQTHQTHREHDDSKANHISVKEINAKLKKLKISLYKNTNQDKKSACFWCTYDYDNPTCYIPKYENDSSVVGYGSFCRPECAVAYLMKENIDDSTKFERYHLLNKLYGKIYDYKRNIKPAPNPYFLLEKYYGNMTIQEYRKLLKTEHTLLVLEKPLTRILPELHEDNEDIMLNYKSGGFREIINENVNFKNSELNHNTNTHHNVHLGNASGIYKVKRQNDRINEPSKSTILKELFT